MDEERSVEPGLGRSGRCSRPSPTCATSATWRRSSASSSGTAATACSGPTSTPTTATPSATSSTSSRAASGSPTSPTTATTSSPRSARSTSPTSSGCSRSAARRPGRRRRDGAGDRHRLAEGHWERAETRDVKKTYNLKTLDELKELCPAFDWDAYVTNLGGGADARWPRCRPAAVVPRAPLDGARPRRRSRTGATWMAAASSAPRAVPLRRLRRDQLRLLRPHPERYAGAAGPLEARRRVWSRARSARPSARSTSSGTSRRAPRR